MTRTFLVRLNVEPSDNLSEIAEDIEDAIDQIGLSVASVAVWAENDLSALPTLGNNQTPNNNTNTQ